MKKTALIVLFIVTGKLQLDVPPFENNKNCNTQIQT
jgi:hypothetical protein